MAKHLITVEVDTDRTQQGLAWLREDGLKHRDEEVYAYAETFGARPGDQWDKPPFTRIVGIKSSELA